MIILGILLWFLIGFVAIVWWVTEDEQITVRQIPALVASSILGPIVILVILYEKVGKIEWLTENKVIFKNRNTKYK